MTQNAEQDFFTCSEVAKKLSMSIFTIQKWVKTGKLGAVKFGGKSVRIPAGAIVAFLNTCEDKKAVTSK